MIIKNKFNSTKIIFGNNQRLTVLKIIKKKTALIVCSKRTKREIILDKNFSFIKTNKVLWIDDVTPNPTLTYLEKKKKHFKNRKFDYIIAIGGGSVIDTAKALMIMFSIKKKKNLKNIIKDISNLKIKNLYKLIVLPTTAGTGSEVTPYATIWDEKNKKKLSLNNKALYPYVAIIDPVLTFNLPKQETINTGLDSLNQAFESIWNKNANKLTLSYAFRSIKLSLSALAKINNNINDKKSRSDLARASVYAGICISQTRTSICHSISYPLTAHFNIPHGLACAFTMIAIIDHISKKNKFFFTKLINTLELASVKEFKKKIKKLFNDLKVKDKNKSYIKNKKKLFYLIKDMQTPGRSDNFIYPIDINFLKLTLKSSYL
ncbi:phosphonoacetaldehyde reductase [Candidatus Pelagibacter ubique]|nr:phosphonoacetaldehyde reductase [Candidatus Pelagibacter ubique]